ncbi:MAG: alpha-amylase family glycosyl hydrolase [Bacteroidota bacterium]|nr:1,4-alpha-glucan branching protein [Bacteroidota bacterium]
MYFRLFALVFSLSLLSCKLMPRQEGVSEKSINMNGPFVTPDWVKQTTIYEVNLRQYTSDGTILAFMQELPRLKALGVETLWFMPLTPIAKENRKGSLGSYYACSDYTSINPEFGTEADFKLLVTKAHEMGFKIIIDWVANHTGWDHRWTKQHPDYYLKDSTTGTFQIASGMDDIIELDFSNPSLRTAMIEAMKYWVTNFDIDGFRCDLAFWVELDFWKEARAVLDQVKPLFWFGEYDQLEKPAYGQVFDASYTWTWMHRAKDFYQQKRPIDSLYAILEAYDKVGDSTLSAWFTTNHDENSWSGTEYEKYGDMARALAVFSITWYGIPLLYSGQEIGNRKRILFFEKDLFEKGPDAEYLNLFYSTLTRLKKNHPALRAGDPSAKTYRLKTSAPNQVFAFLRKNGDREVVVVLNLSGQNDLHFDLIDSLVTGVYKNAFSGATNDFKQGTPFEMQAWEYLVYEK